MRAEIDAGGRKITVDVADVNMSPRDLLADVLATWKATKGAEEPSEGPAYGFSQDRRGWQVSPMNLGGYGRGNEYIADPKAEDRG